MATKISALLAFLLAVTACNAAPDDAEGGGPWSHTDDRGVTIELDARPQRIVAQASVAAALDALGVNVVGVFGPVRTPDGKPDPQVAGLDLERVVDVTGPGEYGKLDLEKLAGVRPDLIVTNMFVPPELWYIDDATAAKAEKRFPILGIDFAGKDVVESIEAVEEVAQTLGADLDAPAATKAKQAFDAAAKRVRSAAADLGDQQILLTSYTPELLYLGDASQFPDSAYYAKLGVPFVPVKAKKDTYWENVSWENADKYDADIVMWDNRNLQSGFRAMKAQPAFATLTAAKNDAYIEWETLAPVSYEAYADVLNRFAEKLERFR